MATGYTLDQCQIYQYMARFVLSLGEALGSCSHTGLLSDMFERHKIGCDPDLHYGPFFTGMEEEEEKEQATLKQAAVSQNQIVETGNGEASTAALISPGELFVTVVLQCADNSIATV